MRKSIACSCNGMFCSSVIRNIFGNGASAVTILLLSFLIGMSTNAFPKETLKNLIDVNRSLSSPLVLHLTSNESPIINNTVSLNHEDDWLFFDAIKPSVIIEEYASNVLISGENLQIGVNGRLAIYAYGTVKKPHVSTFKPLSVYTEENVGGTTKQLAINTYYNNLAELGNSIKSFKLKRDYMALFVNNAYLIIKICDTVLLNLHKL